jgi:TonB family protein
VDARLPEAWNGVFARAFAPSPEGRYVLAMDLHRDLQRATGAAEELEIQHQAQVVPVRPQAPEATLVGPAPASFQVPMPASPTAETRILQAPPVHPAAVVAFDSDPMGAQVYVDSKPLGRAPVDAVDLSFGRHLVRMELAGRETVSATIELKPERPLRAVTFTLPLAATGGGVRTGQLVSFGPEVTPPLRVSGAVPGYPETARERGLEGTPIVELWVSEAGEVINAAVVESAGPLLDNALLAAVQRWRFKPATLRGAPVTVRITVQHHFRR